MEETSFSLDGNPGTSATNIDPTRDPKSLVTLGTIGAVCCGAPIIATGIISLFSFGIFASVVAIVSSAIYFIKSRF